MSQNAARKATQTEHVDVLIVGAGISGVGAAWHLKDKCPNKSFTILETQETFGGTWSTHKYPGIRSDSDLFTFGYKFKPWKGAPIATAGEILKYMREVISENHIEEHIRYSHTVRTANYSRATKLWTITAENLASGERTTLTCNFLWMCQGYYRHATGYTPQWQGMDDYQGQIVHPQTWPEDLDYADKEVLVIGSGATAATLVPAMTDKVGHITMLQRSPTYFAPGLNKNELADTLRELDVPDEWTHEIVRRKVLFDQAEITRRSFEEPDQLKKELIDAARMFLGDDFDLETHFTPKYRPWQQRLAFIPDGDLFTGIRSGKASVVTDEIERFTPNGVLLKSGRELKADIIVTATGFNMCVMGDIEFSVDEEPVDFANTVSWRGMMFTGVPNMVWVFGYFRASWTLRADLIAEFVCRLLQRMDARGDALVVPQLSADEKANMELKPWVEPDNFNPGYLMRSMHLLPKQGAHDPWIHKQDYYTESKELPKVALDDGSLVYESRNADSEAAA